MIDWIWVAILAFTGVIVGTVSIKYGMETQQEVGIWSLFYVAWVFAATTVPFDAPFVTILLASIFAGLIAGTIQITSQTQYAEANPWYADRKPLNQREAILNFVGFGLVAGLVFGLVFGGIAWGLSQL